MSAASGHSRMGDLVAGTIMAAAVVSVMAEHEAEPGYMASKTMATLIVFAAAHGFGGWVGGLYAGDGHHSAAQSLRSGGAFVAAGIPPLLPIVVSVFGWPSYNTAAWVSYFVSLLTIAACGGAVVKARGLSGPKAAGLLVVCVLIGVGLITLKEIVH